MMMPKLWVIRCINESGVWHYYCRVPRLGLGCWIDLATLMRHENKPHGIRSVVYDSKSDAEAVIVGLTLSGQLGALTAKPAFGVLARWATGSTRGASTGRSAPMRLPRSQRSG